MGVVVAVLIIAGVVALVATRSERARPAWNICQ